MNAQNHSDAVRAAREYYNSSDADNFYFHIWGGEDIHVGIYRNEAEPIADASRRTVARMADLVEIIDASSRVLDLGAGYGGSMRYLAQRYGCHCVALNLSEVENERDREMNRRDGLEELIEIVDGDFTHLDYADYAFDMVWSQDAFLHSGDREQVLTEAVRVLKPGGRLVFTDPMQTDDAPATELQPVYDRIHLQSLGSPGFYRRTLAALGLEEILFEEHATQLARHYARVRETLIEHQQELRAQGVSADYIERMKTGLQHWVDAGRKGYLTWGIFVFHRPASEY